MENEDNTNGQDDGVLKAVETDEDEQDSRDQEIAELKRQNLYLRADFDNYRKQALKERSELVKFGAEPILREFLGVLDNLERAAETELTPETMATYKSGIEMIVTQFKKAFERFGVEEVTALGEAFDPALHEALSSEATEDYPANSVSRVFKKPYKLHGKIIRPAQVVVNTGKKED